MQGPRTPETHEFNQIVDFLNLNLRLNNQWPITSEYPTALSASNIHNMSIITEDEKIISHAVLKTLVIKTPIAIFKIGAIGSVVTDPDHRKKGYSSKNIEKCIQLATEQDCDFVILWTDQFDFYRKFGFELAGFDHTYILENKIEIKNKSLKFVTGNNVAPEALQKLYSQHTVHSIRNTEDFRQFLKIPNSNVYTAWSQENQLLAYAVEGKGLDLINYVHEWAGQKDALVDLFNYIQQQKKQPLTIMAPHHSINLRNSLEQISTMNHAGFLGMIKLINSNQLFTKVKKAFRSEGFENIVLEKQNNSIVFGFGSDLYTLDNECDIIQLIFGPFDIHKLNFLSQETQEKLSTLLPMPLWVWGWDSI